MNELDLFATAIAIDDAGEREVLLNRECAGRPEVRRRIDQLLESHFRSHPPLDRVGPEATGAYVPNEEPGVVIAGRYKLLEQIGEGGMGEVWVAVDLNARFHQRANTVRTAVGLAASSASLKKRSHHCHRSTSSWGR